MLSAQAPTEDDALLMIKAILLHLEDLAQSARQENPKSTEPFLFIWNLFRKCYLTRFIPAIRTLCSTPNTGFLFEFCPASILSLLVKFISDFVCQDGDQPARFQDARRLFWDSEIDRETFNEILRQSLMLPWSETEIINEALHVMRRILFSVNNHNSKNVGYL